MGKRLAKKIPTTENHQPALSRLESAIQWQKQELDRLRSSAIIPRLQEQLLRSQIKNPLIKVVLGPRRAGKSMLCIRVLAGIEHAYLNFDDDQIALVDDSNLLLKALDTVYPNVKTILFDEIQNYKNWELLVSKLQRSGYNLILTGSNAHLLSGELGTALTGRHVPIELFPLSYREMKKADIPARVDKNSDRLSEYLRRGGFPEPLLSNVDTGQYLRTLFESILYKDIVRRYRIRTPSQIADLGYFLGNNVASPVGVERLGKSLGIGSNATTQKLLGYLQRTYLFFLLENYSHKVREQMRSPRKSYVIDPGFATALDRSGALKEARILENAVLLDFLQRGEAINRTCFYYRTRNQHEVDFLVRNENTIRMLVQVCFSISDPGTREREIRALVEAARELHCQELYIVTYSQRETIEASGLEIHVRPAEEWLMR